MIRPARETEAPLLSALAMRVKARWSNPSVVGHDWLSTSGAPPDDSLDPALRNLAVAALVREMLKKQTLY